MKARFKKSQRGMSLLEVIVAVFIFTVVFLVALSLYHSANRAYLRTDAATIQQQNIRFAMDRMSETLRDAGASYNASGVRKLADEQIEGAWESAIFVRGDFDSSRETDLESTEFPIVTTGNDEIVGFVLRKATGAGNDETIQIKIDLTEPREAIYTDDDNITDETTKDIRVAATDLTDQTDPPYQLTKVTFDGDGNPVYEVLAENVFRLSFKYYKDDGTTQPVTYNTNAGGADTERAERKQIRRIEVNLTGMTDRPDFGYTDTIAYSPAVPADTKAYRKFTLAQTIVAVNLGMKGKIHYETPPANLNPPSVMTACAGHCRRYLITWEPSTTTGVTRYKVEYSAPANAGAGLAAVSQVETVEGTTYEFEEPAADEAAGVFRTWSFRVAPIYGTLSGDFTTAVSRTSINAESTPQAPANVNVGQYRSEYATAVTWDEVEQNVSPIVSNTCLSTTGTGSVPPDNWKQKANDLDNYKVYRIRSAVGTDATTDVSTATHGTLLNVAPAASCASCLDQLSFKDSTAVPCVGYFYRVKAADLCDVESAYSTSSPEYTLPAPDDLFPSQVGSGPTPASAVSYNAVAGVWSVQLTWPYVSSATNGSPAAAMYRLYRYRKLDTETNYTQETYWDYEGNISAVDNPPGQVGLINASYKYRVEAYYPCATRRPATLSDEYLLACTPPATHTIAISSPAANAIVARPENNAVSLTATVTGSGWSNATIFVKNAARVTIASFAISGPPSGSNTYTASWNNSALGDGVYYISAVATTTLGCRAYSAEVPIELDTIPCGLKLINPDLADNSGNDRSTRMTFQVENNCETAMTFNSITPTWPIAPTSNGAASAIRIIGVSYGASSLYSNATGSATGVTIPLSSSVTIGAGSFLLPTVSSTFTFTFSDNFTSTGAHNSGTDGKFTSIQVNVTAPTPGGPEELLPDSNPIP